MLRDMKERVAFVLVVLFAAGVLLFLSWPLLFGARAV
jgi:hypothetical protein